MSKASIHYNGCSVPVNDAFWNMRNKKVYKPAGTKSSWLIVQLGDGQLADDQYDMITKAFHTYGLHIRNLGDGTHSNSAISNVKSIGDIADKLRRSKKGEAKMILVVLPKEDADKYYSVVKKAGDHIHGMACNLPSHDDSEDPNNCNQVYRQFA